MRDQRRARGIRPCLLAAAALVACSALVPLREIPAHERQRADAIKAGYLYNFLKFVEWPPIVPANTLNACFVGNSGVFDEITTNQSYKRVGTRRLVARRLAPGAPIGACQVLYVDAQRVAAVSDVIYARPTALLTVSDAPDFLRGGGIIALFEKDDRLQFRISADNARLASLRISTSLLLLGRETPP